MSNRHDLYAAYKQAVDNETAARLAAGIIHRWLMSTSRRRDEATEALRQATPRGEDPFVAPSERAA